MATPEELSADSGSNSSSGSGGSGGAETAAPRRSAFRSTDARKKVSLPPRGPLAKLVEVLQVCLIDSKALKTGLTNFLLAYNLRAGVAFLLKIVRTLLRRPKDALSFEKLLGEGSLTFRVEAVRMGLFLGGFTGMYRAVSHGLAVYATKVLRTQWHGAVAGWVAGLSLYFMDRSWHRTLALYMSARMAQLAYNFAKARGYWHFWGSDWAHGDSLLFIISSAQVMYAYVMRPETLPASYYKFIVRQGPIDEVILQAVRDNCRDKPINLPSVMDYVRSNGGEEAIKATQAYLASDRPALIPSRALHPYTPSCALHTLNAFKGTARQIFPVYLTLALIPSVVLRFKNFVKEPTGVVWRSIKSAIQSTTFLAVFCSGYQAVICLQRILLESRGLKDHKLWYYFAGILSSLSILIERKSRRSELALYAFPRAADSLYMILYDHQLAFSVPQGEILLFCCAMSAVMWSYENDESFLSPLVVKLLDRFLPRRGLRREANDAAESSSSFEDTDYEDDNTDGTGSVVSSRQGRQDMPRDRSVLSLNGSYTMVP